MIPDEEGSIVMRLTRDDAGHWSVTETGGSVKSFATADDLIDFLAHTLIETRDDHTAVGDSGDRSTHDGAPGKDETQHRWNVRKPIDEQIEVIVPGETETRIPAHARNVSLEGMYVETGTDVAALPPKTFVRIRTSPPAGGLNPLELAAFVVHASDHGAGLLFTDPQPEAFYRFLQPILQEPAVALANS